MGVVLASDDYTPKSLDNNRKLKTEGLFKWMHVKDAEQLSVKDGSATPIDYVDAAPAAPPCATASEQVSLYFFPRLSRIGRKNDGTAIDMNDLEPAYLTPKKVDEKIAAYMKMTYGNIKAALTNPAVWEFKESVKSYGAIHSQMAAETAEWSFDINGDTLVLQTTDDANSTTDLLQLKASNGKIKFTIANAPDVPRHVGIKYLAGTEVSSAPEPSDHHFQLYYDYLKDTVKNDGTKDITRYIPVVSGVCVEKEINSQKVTVFTTDPCEIRRYVNIPDPGNCKDDISPAIGNLNCGPDGMP
jgi:hypothetical protein